MVNALISIGIFLVLQLVAAVWWAATMNTKMDFMILASKDVNELHKEFGEAANKYSTKAEVQDALAIAKAEIGSALAIANKEVLAMWKQIDLIKSK